MLGRLSFALGSLACQLCASTCALHLPRQETAGDAPRQTSFGDGAVSFDEHSLSLFGQRIFLHSGEMHTWRIPVPSLWPDILQKVKAAGYNAVSIYTHWGMINPAPGVLDFDGYRALAPFYEAALEAGIWVILRPGPYINSESSAGGMAHWVTSEIAGKLRTNDTDWRDSYQQYIRGVIEESVPYQITRGGPIIAVQIDNEYNQHFDGGIGGEYYDDIEDIYRESDMEVPWTYNNAGMGANFINGTGAVDIYGIDDYPQRYDCAHPDVWKPVKQEYRPFHLDNNPWEPLFFPEFQAGSPLGWGPGSANYSGCQLLTGPEWMNVAYKNLWAMNSKMLSYYMIYGGTAWGSIPHPGAYTSYDWGAAISENRGLSPKYEEMKRQGYFTRSSLGFYKTEWMGSSNTVYSPSVDILSSDAIFVTLLENPDTHSRFYITRNNDSTSKDANDFKITVSTSVGELEIPLVASALTIGGRQSKVLVTDYAFGTSSSLLYSTSEVYYSGIIDGRDVILLYGDSTQEHEFALELKDADPSNLANIAYTPFTNGTTIVSISTGASGILTIHDSPSQLVLFADTGNATSFYAPTIAGSGPFRNYWQIGTNDSVLVGGPYLVRTATIEGNTLALRGDIVKNTTLSIVAPAGITTITWNDDSLDISPALTQTGGWTARVTFEDPKVIPPTLDGWKYKNSLPELVEGYDDSWWTLANKTETNIPEKPYYGDGRILYGCDYGFCENVVVWRGHFDSAGQHKSVNLSINGGTGFAGSVWLNDVFLNTSYGNSSNGANKIEETDDLFILPDGALNIGPNVLTIVQDNMGLNETGNLVQVNGDVSKNPRGIRGFKLDDGEFGEWRVQGKMGGYNGFVDRYRGVINEGGLYGERAGWHLPGYDTSGWEDRNLEDGLPGDSAGVGFFVKTFDLDVPKGYDIAMSFNFLEDEDQTYRAYFWVNGWMMGKRIANLGPQFQFPVHEGILDYHGSNTIAVALWAMEAQDGISPNLQLLVDNVWQGGLADIELNNPEWSAEGRESS